MKTRLALGAAVLSGAFTTAPHSANGQVVTTLAGSGAHGSADGRGTAASFDGPGGVSVDRSGNVYVADTRNSRIRKVTPDGLVTTLADFSQGYPDHPIGVAVDGSGNVWEVDPVGDGIDGGDLEKLAPDGHWLPVTLRWPAVDLPLLVFDDAIAIAADQDGNLYVTSYITGVVKFDPTGNGTILTKDLLEAQGITVDGLGNVYVADTHGNRIWKISPDGRAASLAGSGATGRADGPGALATFNAPLGVAVDTAGNVYVADQMNHLIRRITADGTVSTVAGSGHYGYRDGAGADASFYEPGSVAVDAFGNLYVADTGNNVIRKIVLAQGPGSGPWLVPSVARAQGADGAFWTSDLTLHNRSDSPAGVTIRFLGNGGDGRTGPAQSVTLGPRQTAAYPDVLASLFGLSGGWGALRIEGASNQIVARSRTYTVSAGGGVGADIPAVAASAMVTDQTQPSPVLAGLREDDGSRTNLVLVSGSSFPVDVIAFAADASGSALGQKTYTLPPFGTIQDPSFLSSPELGGGRQAAGVTITLFTPTPGGSFTGLAVVIDRRSNDPAAVLPQ